MGLNVNITNTASIVAKSALCSQLKTIGKEAVYRQVHNITDFRTNAFIISALIQVLSRIGVANISAKESVGTPEAPFRYQEAVKTTFREGLGFFLSYGLVRGIQRGSRKFLLNHLGITPPPAVNPFPKVSTSARQLGSQLYHAIFNKSGIPLIERSNLDDLMIHYDKLDFKFDVAKEARQLKVEKAIDWVYKLIGRVDFTNPEKLKALGEYYHVDVKKMSSDAVKLFLKQHKFRQFFTWLPLIVGSIPALILSGYCLEKFSQKYAEPLAQKIARSLHKNDATPAPVPTVPSQKPAFKPNPLASFPTVAYANQYQPQAMAPMFYGHPAPTGTQYAQPQQAWAYTNLPRY